MIFEQTKNVIDVDRKGTSKVVEKMMSMTTEEDKNQENKKEAKSYSGKRQYILSNIWRVFQILLEFT